MKRSEGTIERANEASAKTTVLRIRKKTLIDPTVGEEGFAAESVCSAGKVPAIAVADQHYDLVKLLTYLRECGQPTQDIYRHSYGINSFCIDGYN